MTEVGGIPSTGAFLGDRHQANRGHQPACSPDPSPLVRIALQGGGSRRFYHLGSSLAVRAEWMGTAEARETFR